MKPEIQTLIIGAILGAVLAFSVTELNKWSERRIEKKKAIMCLKIELRPIKSSIDALVKLSSDETKVGPETGPRLSESDILQLDMATQISQFMFYGEELAEKVYHLSLCLRDTNKCRQKAYEFLSNQSDPKFKLNIIVYEDGIKEAQKLLNEINDMIYFEEDSPKS